MPSAPIFIAAKFSRRGLARIANQWMSFQRSIDLAKGSDEFIFEIPFISVNFPVAFVSPD